MASEKIVKFVDEIKTLTVLELAELVKAIEEEFGVTAAAPVVVAGGAAAGAAAAEEKTEFDVVLVEAGASKMGVIKLVKEMTGLGLKESKELVDNAPKTIKEGVSKDLLHVTKEQMISNFIMGAESTLNRMTAAGSALLLRGAVQEMEEVIQKIEVVSQEDIAQVMQLIFSGQPSYSAVGNLKGVDFSNTVEKIFS